MSSLQLAIFRARADRPQPYVKFQEKPMVVLMPEVSRTPQKITSPPEEPGRLTAKHIIKHVAEKRSLTYEQVVGRSRLKSYVEARHVAMYLVRSLLLTSYPEIGRRFGGKDHSTAIHGIRKVQRRVESDGDFAGSIEALRRELMPVNADAEPA